MDTPHTHPSWCCIQEAPAFLWPLGHSLLTFTQAHSCNCASVILCLKPEMSYAYFSWVFFLFLSTVIAAKIVLNKNSQYVVTLFVAIEVLWQQGHHFGCFIPCEHMQLFCSCTCAFNQVGTLMLLPHVPPTPAFKGTFTLYTMFILSISCGAFPFKHDQI